MSANYERERAIMEGERNAASDRYFDARPQLDTLENGSIYDAGFTDAYRTQAAKIEALESASQWQPIEAAPKDGTSMLVYHNRMTLEAWYSLPWNKFVVAESGGTNNIMPTHWMPLPKPPIAGEAT